MIVSLDAGEMTVAQVLAAMRNSVARISGVVDQKAGPQSAYQTDLDGLVAEIAFAKWRNVCPDLTVSPRVGGSDAVVKGWRIDVKATRHVTGRLLASRTKKAEYADAYVLAVVRDNTVRFPGWATSADLLRDENLTDFGYGQVFALTQAQLRPFSEIA
jgi:hypothetical protein